MNDEIFWIREICDADWRKKLVLSETKEMFAKKTLNDAMEAYDHRLKVIEELETKKAPRL